MGHDPLGVSRATCGSRMCMNRTRIRTQANGANPVGRWDYGPLFWPIFPVNRCRGAYGDDQLHTGSLHGHAGHQRHGLPDVDRGSQGLSFPHPECQQRPLHQSGFVQGRWDSPGAAARSQMAIRSLIKQAINNSSPTPKSRWFPQWPMPPAIRPTGIQVTGVQMPLPACASIPDPAVEHQRRAFRPDPCLADRWSCRWRT